MSQDNWGGGFGGGRNNMGNRRPGKKNFSNRGNAQKRDLFEAVCAECGKTCTVPFRPSGDKPVYCDNCFSQRKRNSFKPEERAFNRDKGHDRNRPRPDLSGVDYREELKSINRKLDQILQIVNPVEPKKLTLKPESIVTKVLTAPKPEVKPELQPEAKKEKKTADKKTKETKGKIKPAEKKTKKVVKTVAKKTS